MNKNTALHSYGLYILIVVLGILQIVLSNCLSNYGKKLSDLTKLTSSLVSENEHIKKKIASTSALTNLTKRAYDLGFTQKAQIVYLEELYSVAQNSL